MKIEIIYGDRGCGKSTEILNSLNTTENILIIVPNSAIKKWYELKIKEKFPNVRISYNMEQSLIGKNCDKIFIDDIRVFDWKFIGRCLGLALDINGECYIYLSYIPIYCPYPIIRTIISVPEKETTVEFINECKNILKLNNAYYYNNNMPLNIDMLMVYRKMKIAEEINKWK